MALIMILIKQNVEQNIKRTFSNRRIIRKLKMALHNSILTFTQLFLLIRERKDFGCFLNV